MTRHRLSACATTLVLCLSVCARGQDSAGCRTTRPPDQPFVPPFSPWRLEPPSYWYGTAALWTNLDARGIWHTRNNPIKGKTTQKLFYWAQDFDWRTEMQPNLLLYARRLDGEAPVVFGPFPASAAFTGRAAISTGIDLSPGCWQVTAHYRDRTLSYVVSVEP